jgi:hypothetical protein
MSLASDIVDLLSLLNETQIQESKLMVYFTLIIFSWSLFQFSLNLVVTRGRSFTSVPIDAILDNDDSDDSDQYKNALKSYKDKSKKKKRNCAKFWKIFNIKLLNSEVWSILVTLMFQDGPFLALRLTAVINFDVRTFVTVFFTCKNAIILFLQFYRLSAIYLEEDKEEENLESAKSQSSIRLSELGVTQNLEAILKVSPMLSLNSNMAHSVLESSLLKNFNETTCWCSCHQRKINQK